MQMAVLMCQLEEEANKMVVFFFFSFLMTLEFWGFSSWLIPASQEFMESSIPYNSGNYITLGTILL